MPSILFIDALMQFWYVSGAPTIQDSFSVVGGSAHDYKLYRRAINISWIRRSLYSHGYGKLMRYSWASKHAPSTKICAERNKRSLDPFSWTDVLVNLRNLAWILGVCSPASVDHEASRKYRESDAGRLSPAVTPASSLLPRLFSFCRMNMTW